MFTDIFGYSRMMSRDENKMIQLLAIHDGIIEDKVKNHKGQIVKKIGDSILAEFNSSIEALSCAVEIQASLKDYCNDKNEEDKIIIRIGIHVGDIIVKDNDIFGEGVNVASRLEQLADPGGICLSNAVYNSAKSSNQFNIVKHGEVELKNILEKYTIYKVPSVYGDQYRRKETDSDSKNQFSYKVKKITNLPVKFLSPIEVATYPALFVLTYFSITLYYITLKKGIGLFEILGKSLVQYDIILIFIASLVFFIIGGSLFLCCQICQSNIF